MRHSIIFTLCMLVCSPVYFVIISASLLPDNDIAVELPTSSSGNLEMGCPSVPNPSNRLPPVTEDSRVDRTSTTGPNARPPTPFERTRATLLATIAADPTLLSDVLPTAVVRALDRFFRIADPSPYARVPSKELLSQLQDVPPPDAYNRCGPWKYEPSGYLVRDCQRDRPPQRGQPFDYGYVQAGGRRRPSGRRVPPATSDTPEKPKSRFVLSSKAAGEKLETNVSPRSSSVKRQTLRY